MAFFITRRQSLLLGMGLLGAFFLISGSIIYSRNKARIPTSSLSSTTPEATPTPAPRLAHPGPPGADSPSTGTGFVLNEFHRSLVKDGKVVWEVFGKRGSYSPGEHVASIEAPLLKLYDSKNGDVEVSAQRAELSLSTTELTKADLFDTVVITHRNETTIKTNHATFNRTTNSIDVPVPFELDHPTFLLVGKRLHANIDSQEIVITKGVRTTLKPKVGGKK